MYHGIILDMAFNDTSYPKKLKLFAKRKSSSNGWILYGIEIADDKFDKTIKEIQTNMKSDKPYYSHFYNDEIMIVIFKGKLFKVKPHISTWSPVIKYGKTLGIPAEQLDFWPNRFQDEIHYFDSNDFIK
jgi:hypothetical protein